MSRDMDYSFQYMNPKMARMMKEALTCPHCLSGALHCDCYENAMVVPHWGTTAPSSKESGGVITEDGYQVLSSVLFDREYKVRVPQEREIRRSDEVVIFIGTFIPIYGNMITDGLKHLWFLYTDDCKLLLAKGAKIVYVTYFHQDLPHWALELLELAGVDMSICSRVKESTRYNKVYVPDPSLVTLSRTELLCNERFYYRGFVDVIHVIKSKICPNTQFEKLYFTRTQLSGNKDKDVCGEREIENLFRGKGYHIIAPEKLTVRDQIAMLMGCREFVATEGSISHNALFCSSGCKHIILRKTNFINPHQLVVNEVAELDVVYIDVNKSIRASRETPWFGPFYLYITPELCRYFGISEKQRPLFLRASWWLYFIRYSLLFLKLKHYGDLLEHKFIRCNRTVK